MTKVSNKSNPDQVKKVINENAESQHSSEVVKFTNGAAGYWVGGFDYPVTSSNIQLDKVGAIDGGVASIFYQGNPLSKVSFVGGDVVMLIGANTVGVIALVGIIYNKKDDNFIVTIAEE